MIEPITDICNCKDIDTKQQSLFKSTEVRIRGKVKCNIIANVRKDQNKQ